VAESKSLTGASTSRATARLSVDRFVRSLSRCNRSSTPLRLRSQSSAQLAVPPHCGQMPFRLDTASRSRRMRTERAPLKRPRASHRWRCRRSPCGNERGPHHRGANRGDFTDLACRARIEDVAACLAARRAGRADGRTRRPRVVDGWLGCRRAAAQFARTAGVPVRAGLGTRSQVPERLRVIQPVARLYVAKANAGVASVACARF
jgi:hypothetical protein